MFYLTSAVALLLGLFSFTLPSTPPAKGESISVKQLFGLDALSLLKDRSFPDLPVVLDVDLHPAGLLLPDCQSSG